MDFYFSINIAVFSRFMGDFALFKGGKSRFMGEFLPVKGEDSRFKGEQLILWAIYSRMCNKQGKSSYPAKTHIKSNNKYMITRNPKAIKVNWLYAQK